MMVTIMVIMMVIMMIVVMIMLTQDTRARPIMTTPVKLKFGDTWFEMINIMTLIFL